MQLIITGDKSRYQFFRDMVREGAVGSHSDFFTEKMGENDIYLTSDRGKVKDCVYYSEKVPLNTVVCFPKEYGDTSVSYGIDDRVIVFDEFPYGTDENMANLEKIIQSGRFGQLEVVLFQNDRIALASDISTEEMAVEDAEMQYKRRNISVRRYSVKDRPDFLLWSRGLQHAGGVGVFAPFIEEARYYLDTFDSCYDLEYELTLHSIIENPEILDSYFGFEHKLKGANVWDLYYKKAYGYYWGNNSVIDEFMVGVYKRGIANLCTWDLSVDVSELKRSVRDLFSQQLKCFPSLIYEGEEEGYAQFLNRNMKEVLAFKHKIVGFFTEELKRFIKMRIARDIERMERLLNGYTN